MLKLSTIIIYCCCILINGVKQPKHQYNDEVYTKYLVKGVRKQLGLFNNRMLRSGRHSYDKRTKSLIISTILSNSEEEEKLIDVCLPKSLKKFYRRHTICLFQRIRVFASTSWTITNFCIPSIGRILIKDFKRQHT